MRVLGIDPGLQRTGYGCVLAPSDPMKAPSLVEAGHFRFDPRRSVGERLVELERDLDALLARLRPSCVCIESLFAHGVHPRTAIIMGHARGVILLAAARTGVEIVEVPPARVKKALTGNGRAGKGQIQSAVAALLGLAVAPEPADVSDALAVAVCGSRRAVGGPGGSGGSGVAGVPGAAA